MCVTVYYFYLGFMKVWCILLGLLWCMPCYFYMGFFLVWCNGAFFFFPSCKGLPTHSFCLYWMAQKTSMSGSEASPCPTVLGCSVLDGTEDVSVWQGGLTMPHCPELFCTGWHRRHQCPAVRPHHSPLSWAVLAASRPRQPSCLELLLSCPSPWGHVQHDLGQQP